MFWKNSPTHHGLAFSVSFACQIVSLQNSRCSLPKRGSTISAKPDSKVRGRKRQVMNRDTNTCLPPPIQGQKSPEPRYIRRTGLNIPVVISNELRGLIGGNDISNRSQILSDLGKYIRENNLYINGEKKRVLCDERLSAVFKVTGEVSSRDFFRLLKPHLTDPSALGPEYETRAKEYFEKYLEERGARASWLAPRRYTDPRGKNSIAAQKELRKQRQGMFAEVYIDPCLRPLCNGKSYLSRPDALKAVWAYIKKHGLQDARNRRRIRVSDTLRDALRLPEIEWLDSFKLGSYVFRLMSKSEK